MRIWASAMGHSLSCGWKPDLRPGIKAGSADKRKSARKTQGAASAQLTVSGIGGRDRGGGGTRSITWGYETDHARIGRLRIGRRACSFKLMTLSSLRKRLRRKSPRSGIGGDESRIVLPCKSEHHRVSHNQAVLQAQVCCRERDVLGQVEDGRLLHRRYGIKRLVLRALASDPLLHRGGVAQPVREFRSMRAVGEKLDPA